MEKKETATARAGAKDTEQKKTPKVPAASVYRVKDLAENAESVFGKNVRSECVVAAFKNAGKAEATKEDAQKIVREFLKKEVK